MMKRTATLMSLAALALAGCADTAAPEWSDGSLSLEGEPGSLAVVWPDADDDSGVTAFLVRVDGEAAARLDRTEHRYSVASLDAISDHRVEITAMDAAGNESSALEVTLPGDHATPAFDEGRLSATAAGERWAGAPLSVALTWPAAQDELGVTAYVVRVGSEEVARVEASERATTLADVDLSERRTFSVVAVDEAGNESDALSTDDAFAPTFPGAGSRLELGPPEAPVLTLSWPAATDDVAVTGYSVRRGRGVNELELARLDPTTLSHAVGTVEGNPPFSVVALDAAGHERALWFEPALLGSLSDTSRVFQDVLGGGLSRSDLDAAIGVMSRGRSSDPMRSGVGVAGGPGSRPPGGGGSGGVGGLIGSRGFGRGTRAPVRGRVTLDAVESTSGPGTYSADTVVMIFRRRIRAIQTCYERELRSTSTISGRVRLALTVQTNGSTRVQILSNTTGSPATGNCALRTAQRFRFNPGPEGGSFTVHIPLSFAVE